jgi:hypothetical protein
VLNDLLNIDATLLNSKVFSWLEIANSRIHDTTKKKPIELFKQERALLEPFYESVKEIKTDELKTSTISLSELDIDITYHTTISDYEKVLGASYASA